MSNPEIGPYLLPYAGQQLTTGRQAEVYANHFIAVHLNEIGGGKTYSQLSSELRACTSNCESLQSQVDTVFKGTTLKGLLLEAYAFATMGAIALIAGIAAFAIAGLLMILVIAGYVHFRRTPPDVEILASDKKDAGENPSGATA
jgi:hypothetical protein